MAHEEEAQRVVPEREGCEGEAHERHAVELVRQEAFPERRWKGVKGTEEVSKLLQVERHDELHAKLKEGVLPPPLGTPEHAPNSLRCGRGFAGLRSELSREKARRLLSAGEGVCDGVTCSWMHKPCGGTERDAALACKRQRASKWNPRSLLFDQLVIVEREPHARHPSLESTFQLVKGYLHVRGETRLLEKDGVLIDGEHVEKRGHSPEFSIRRKLWITLAKVHQDGAVDGEGVVLNRNLDAIGGLPTRRFPIFVIEELPVVSRRHHHRRPPNLHRLRPLFCRHEHSRACFVVLSSFHEPGHEPDISFEAAIEERLPQCCSVDVPVTVVERRTVRRLVIFHPHQHILVRALERVLESELLDLIQPHAVVVHKRRVWADETDAEALPSEGSRKPETARAAPHHNHLPI
mmetsp:Transcript_3482/g.12479  ORF Transcript_3482/g.12479 Transcript_3482/m.12479 type:complete len:407 (-) Transcript_3482:933-2153(-)